MIVGLVTVAAELFVNRMFHLGYSGTVALPETVFTPSGASYLRNEKMFAPRPGLLPVGP